MTIRQEHQREYARVALACIRLFNGSAALLAPAAVARRLGTSPDRSAGMTYALRLFGIRTVVIGAELVLPSEAARTRSLRQGVVIHASDAVAALVAGAGRQLPPRTAATTALVSLVNLTLALLAQSRRTSPYPTVPNRER